MLSCKAFFALRNAKFSKVSFLPSLFRRERFISYRQVIRNRPGDNRNVCLDQRAASEPALALSLLADSRAFGAHRIAKLAPATTVASLYLAAQTHRHTHRNFGTTPIFKRPPGLRLIPTCCLSTIIPRTQVASNYRWRTRTVHCVGSRFAVMVKSVAPSVIVS